MVFTLAIPEEGKALPPPNIVNKNSVWLAGLGWFTAMLGNGLNHRPPLKSGVHRQALMATIGWFIGYHLTKLENYRFAKRDRDIMGYIKLHPEDFPPKEERTFAEIIEPFRPVR